MLMLLLRHLRRLPLKLLDPLFRAQIARHLLPVRAIGLDSRLALAGELFLPVCFALGVFAEGVVLVAFDVVGGFYTAERM